MANAIKLPSGAYRCRPTAVINGEKITKSFTVHPRETGGNSKKAKAKAEALAREWQISLEHERTFSVTVEKAMSDYIEDRSAVLSPSTINGYIQMTKFFDSIKDMYAMDVDTQTVQRLINDMALSLSEKTIVNRIGFLLSALDYAGNDRKFKLRYPQKAQAEISTPDHDEVLLLLRSAPAALRIPICLAAFCGMRRSEICALKHSDILRDMKKIYIHASMVRSPEGGFVYRDQNKTKKSTRTIPVIPYDLLDLIPDEDPESYVCQIRNPNKLTEKFINLRDSLCLSCSFHDLRHYATSFRADLGIDEKYIRDELGWTAGSAVYSDVYNNPLRSQSKIYADMTNKFVGDKFGDVLKKA